LIRATRHVVNVVFFPSIVGVEDGHLATSGECLGELGYEQ
jgi:hypothetical protein